MPQTRKTKTASKSIKKTATTVKISKEDGKNEKPLNASFAVNITKKIRNINLSKNINAKSVLKKQVIIPVIIIILIAFLYYFKGLFVVATVNGEPITSVALINEMEKESGKQSLNSLVSESLIMQEAHKENVTITNKAIDNQIKTLKDSLSAQGQSLNSALSQRDMTENDLRDQIRIQLMVNKMLGNKIKVTNKEINDYYNKNKSSFPPGMDEKSAKSSIKQQLEQQKIASYFQTWLAGLEQKAKINYFVNL